MYLALYLSAHLICEIPIVKYSFFCSIVLDDISRQTQNNKIKEESWSDESRWINY